MAFSSAISTLESTMQRVLEELHHLNTSIHQPERTSPSASAHPISPLQVHVDASGNIHLSGGTLSPNPISLAQNPSSSQGCNSLALIPIAGSQSPPKKCLFDLPTRSFSQMAIRDDRQL